MGISDTEQAKVFEVLFVLREIRDKISLPCYFPDKNAAKEGVTKVTDRVEAVEKKLGTNEWLVGLAPTVSDLFLMEVVDIFQMITEGTWLKDHTTLEAHNARTKEIPNIKEYHNSSRFFEGPFNNPVASVNNLPPDYWK